MKNAASVAEAKQIGYRDLIKAREEELQRDILPGFMATVKDPGTSNRMTVVYSGYAQERYSKTLSVAGKEG